jgi:hypothetical protein
MAELWKQLHLRALNNNGKSEHLYIRKFTMMVPRYTSGCKCKENWNLWLHDNPPVYGKNGEFFEWSVKAHNYVNKKLGKREFTVDEAREYYSKLN